MGTQEILLHQAETQGIEKGIDLGIEKGIDLGIEKGASSKEAEKNKTFTTSLLTSTDFDDAKIALLVGVTEQYVIDLRSELKK